MVDLTIPAVESPPREADRGHYRRVPAVESLRLGNQRDLTVRLPSDYSASDRRYPVAYLQDGQNLFGPPELSGSSWNAGIALQQLEDQGIAIIAVGVPHAEGDRIREYSPIPDSRHGGGGGELYLGFLVETVVPRIDAAFRTLPDPMHRAVLGSSLGGLISLWCALRHPEVFGSVGALSPSLGFADGAIFEELAKARRLPRRVYLDVGTEEIPDASWLDRLFRRRSSWHYARRVRRLRRRLVEAGLRPGVDLLHVEEPGAGHSEVAWGRRLPLALRFLFSEPAGR